MIISFAIFIGLILLSCSYNNKTNENKNLIGKWVMDSISTPNVNHYDCYFQDCNILTFQNESDYQYQEQCGCVRFTEKGKYFIVYNPKRGLKTIALIPDIKFDEKDTVRMKYRVFDITSISSDRLQIVAETEFIDQGEGVKHLVFNKTFIYKRKK